MATTSRTDLGRRIWSSLGEDAAPLVRTYYSTYTGRAFETLAGGGDRRGTANRIVADDIVAVSLLGVNIPPQVSLELLDLSNDTVPELLKAIPVKKYLWEVEESTIIKGSPADQLWNYLDRIVGVGWVTAGKLMARKRPRLIPVFDRVVRVALMPRRSNTFWVSLRRELQDPALVQRLRDLKTEASLDRKVSLLRVLDVAVWMAGPEKPKNEPNPHMTDEEMREAAADRIWGDWEATIYPTLEDAKAGRNGRPATREPAEE